MNNAENNKMYELTDDELKRLKRERAASDTHFVVLYWTKRRAQKEGFISSGYHTSTDLYDVRDLVCLEFDTFDEAQDYLVSCIENHGYVWADDVDDEE